MAEVLIKFKVLRKHWLPFFYWIWKGKRIEIKNPLTQIIPDSVLWVARLHSGFEQLR